MSVTTSFDGLFGSARGRAQTGPCRTNLDNLLDIRQRSQVDRTWFQVRDLLAAYGLDSANAPRACHYNEKAVFALLHANLGLRSDAAARCWLAHVPLFLTDIDFRACVMPHQDNQALLSTFGANGSYTMLPQRQQLEHVMPVLRVYEHALPELDLGPLPDRNALQKELQQITRT